MIAPMDRVTVVGMRSTAREVLQSLQSLGVVQIDPFEPDEELLSRNRLEGAERDEADRWAAALGRIGSLRDLLGARKVAPAPRSEVPGDLSEIEAWLEDVGSQVEAVVAERAQAREELAVVEEHLPLFREVAPVLGSVEAGRYLAGVPFLAAADDLPAITEALSGELEGRVAWSERPYGDQRLVVAVALRREHEALRRALSKAGVAPLSLPARFADLDVAKAVHRMEERSRQLPNRLSTLQQQLDKAATQHGPKLATLQAIASNHHGRLERLEDLATGRYAFALRGWVPSADVRKVVDGLRKQFGDDLIVEHRPADEHHDVGVPTKLDNPEWMRPFQGLLRLFAPPKYGAFDPTWTLALFFPLYFGIVVGDAAYGAIFLAFGLFLRSRWKKGKDFSLGPLNITIPNRDLHGVSTVIAWCAGWAIVWGIVYGEVFGNFFERWPQGRPIFYPGDRGIFEILIFRVEVFAPMLILTLGFGVLQVLMGWGIRAYYGWKHKDHHHMWEGIGMVAGLTGIVIFAVAYLQDALSAPVLILFAMLMGAFLVSAVLARMPLMLVEVISNSGNILSYLRLFAVGLSAALVANLGVDAGFALNAAVPVPVLGELLAILVALLINMSAVILTLVGHTLQPLRLQYVEFFTKFGFYEQSGRAYTPFRLHGGKA